MTDIYKFWQMAENLKSEIRWNASPWGIVGTDKFQNTIFDNTAGHSYSALLMAMLISEYYKIDNLDMNKVFKMIIVHDLPEAVAGDLDAYEAILNPELKKSKHQSELNALDEMTDSLPNDLKNIFKNIWNEYEEQITNESKFVKLCDRLETISQMARADISTRELADVTAAASYGNVIFMSFPEYKEIINMFKEKQKNNFTAQGFMWKKEFDVFQ